MNPLRPRTDLGTHEVLNQPDPMVWLALWAGDGPLQSLVRARAPDHAHDLEHFASLLGSAHRVEAGRLANTHPPTLQSFDRAGRRIDMVAYHGAYHELMDLGIAAGYSALAWTSPKPGAHVAHAALVYLMSQVEPGVCCPMTMTYAAVPALSTDPPAMTTWIEGALSLQHDPTDRPAREKKGLTIGMAMTEKQGGSDIRANTTRAEHGTDGYRLSGHKWFCSAPNSDALLTLAQTDHGLTCFVVPRWMPDGIRNPIHIMRLKDKLGNRSNASAEIEYHGAFALRLGEEGRGIGTILEMVHHTRLDTAMAPAGLMRRALVEAKWWAEGRRAFGRPLINQPLMQAVLADLALEWMGSLFMGLRVAESFGARDPETEGFARLAVALAKYWSNKRAPFMIHEAMECLGGSGYVEDGPMPLLYREAPLNGIWEGAGNVICLDVIRTIEKVPDAREALHAELEAARGGNAHFDRALDQARDRYAHGVDQIEARRFVETMALLLQGALLIRHGDALAADAFCASRLGGDWGRTAGTLPPATEASHILALV